MRSLTVQLSEASSDHGHYVDRARDRARSASVNHLSDCDATQHYVPSSETFPTRRRLQDLRLQIALLNRETDKFEHLNYSSANIFGIPSMIEEEINALTVHNCKCTGLESEDAPPKQASSSSTSTKESLAIGIQRTMVHVMNCYVTFAWSQLWRATLFVAFHVSIRFLPIPI